MPRPNPPRLLGGEEHLARRIALERERRGWTTEGLAKRMTDAGCPINQSAIWKIENGDPPRRITYDEALAFGEAFEIPLDELALPPGLAGAGHVRDLVRKYAELRRVAVETYDEMREIVDETVRLAESFPEAERAFVESWASLRDQIPGLVEPPLPRRRRRSRG